MAIAKFGTLLGLLLVSACGEMINTSTAIFENTANDQELATYLDATVRRRISDVGGTCKISPNHGGFLACLTPKKLSVYTGIDPDGYVFIELTSDTTTILPTTKSKYESGYYLTSEHNEWENWINTEFADYEFVKKIRRSTTGIVQEF